MPLLMIAAAVTALMVGCSSPPPKAPPVKGEVHPANASEEAVADLLELVKDAKPRRFRAERGASLEQVLSGWAKTDSRKWMWMAGESPTTTGEIDESDLRAALLALSQQFRSDRARVVVDLPNRRELVAKAPEVYPDGCIDAPVGSIVLGKHCSTSSVWELLPGETLMSAMQRWSTTAGLTPKWALQTDWPVVAKERRVYRGGLIEALQALAIDLDREGVHLKFQVRTLSGELTFELVPIEEKK
jgi:hypothetical protein